MNFHEAMKWFLVAFMAFGVLWNIGTVGRPGSANTPQAAVITAITGGLVIAGILLWL